MDEIARIREDGRVQLRRGLLRMWAAWQAVGAVLLIVAVTWAPELATPAVGVTLAAPLGLVLRASER